MTKTSKQNSISAKSMAMAGLSAAILAIISQISIPMPAGVPITLQVFAVALLGVILGSRLSALSIVVYILLGAAGIPVFSGFRGGLSVLTGVTGGYIWSWPIMAIFCGLQPETANHKRDIIIGSALSIIGLMICECAGGLQWGLLSGGNYPLIMIYSLTAFIPKDIILTIAAVLIGRKIKRRLK